MMKKAMIVVLARKAKDGELKLVDNFELASSKTKAVSGMIKNITGGKSALLLIDRANKNANLATRNLINVRNLIPENLYAFELMNRKNVLMDVKTLDGFGKLTTRK